MSGFCFVFFNSEGLTKGQAEDRMKSLSVEVTRWCKAGDWRCVQIEKPEEENEKNLTDMQDWQRWTDVKMKKWNEATDNNKAEWIIAAPTEIWTSP